MSWSKLRKISDKQPLLKHEIALPKDQYVSALFVVLKRRNLKKLAIYLICFFVYLFFLSVAI